MAIFMRKYILINNQKVLSVRFLTKEMLADIEPYQLNSNSTGGEHNKRPYEQNPNQLISLYEVTNEMRKLKGLKPLKLIMI